jgi:hypothetical protein
LLSIYLKQKSGFKATEIGHRAPIYKKKKRRRIFDRGVRQEGKVAKRGSPAEGTTSLSAAATAIVADDFAASFRLDGLGRKGNAVYASADVFKQITIGAGPDDMTEAEIGDIVLWRANSNRIEEISIAFHIEGNGIVSAITNMDSESGKFAVELFEEMT